jgi:transcriptional regulator with XRE-family HTH domain
MVMFVSIGDVFRRAREQRGFSQRQLAERAGISSSFVTRLERNLANPTWRTIGQLAAVLSATPRLRLVPDNNEVASTANLVSQAKPIERLRAQRVNVLGALSWLDECEVPFVVTGAVAALLQGFPTPASDLRVVVHDTDEGLLALQRVLLGNQLLFEEFEADELRTIVQRDWPIDDCVMQVTPIDELPVSISIELLTDYVVRVLPPHELLADEEVASTVQISTMRSSEP